MPSSLYSIKCFIKNDLYRLCIYSDDDDDDKQNSTNIPLITDSFDFTSTNIPIDKIIPSLTRLNFELINDKKNTIIPKTIILNHLLNVQQKKAIRNRHRRNFDTNIDILDTNEVTPVVEQSFQTNYGLLNSTASENMASQTLTAGRQFKFARFFSNQSSVDSDINTPFETVIKITYVDVSNSIRWNIKRSIIQVESEDIANELYTNLNLCLTTLKHRPHRLLAFVNPFGGKGRAQFVYERKVLPIFNEANITVNSIYTERANHAQDYVINEDLNDYDGLVCVGGDGMFAELCHGLLLRTSHEEKLNMNDRRVNIIRPKLKIGIIPAGSTDAVVFGTTGLNDPITSALQIIVGETLPIDIATIHNEKGFVSFMATMLAYGFFGDIIQQSDKWRCLGPLRYDFAGFYQFIRNRSYHSELTITLSSSDSSQISHPPLIIPMNNIDARTTVSISPDSPEFLNIVNPIITENNHVIDKIVTPALVFCSRNCGTCAVEGKHDTEKVHSPLQIKREGRYTTINCLNMPGRCAKSKFGMSPFVHLGDGSFDLILVKRSWRTGFLRFLWQVANDSRSIEDLPNVERYRVSEVLIHPMHTDRIRLGHWACDGELISGNEIQIRIHRQALHLFASGIQFNKLDEYNPINKSQRKNCPSCFRFKKSKDNEINNY